MLREAGLKAYPVLIGTKDYFNLYVDFPSVLFNHCIVMLELKEKNIFLDPTCTTCSFGDLPVDDQERKVLVFKENGFQIIDTSLFDAEHNKIIHYFEVNLTKDGTIKAEKKVIPFGFYNQVQRAWLLYSQPEMIRQSIEEGIQEISVGGRLNSYEIENLEDWNKPVILKYDFGGPFYWITAGTLRILPQLPELATDLVAKQKRNYPVELGLPNTEERQIIINFPEDFIIRYLPENIHLDSPWLQFQVEYIFKGRTLYFKERKVFKERIVSVQDYPRFKNFYEELLRKINQRVVLEKTDK
ncbi:MAG: hypothetical protein N2Z79_03760, partial [Candidatus Omnitrophica bacterium]|nr:hypothetical protein [Candidatus Omnitrophota bacterium]